ncbi:hypothetical protein TNCV_4153751 [Trichonephila clavipes]|nr:hypothetical protein TNCV_4153751 [Trichonephila clavipes]
MCRGYIWATTRSGKLCHLVDRKQLHEFGLTNLPVIKRSLCMYHHFNDFKISVFMTERLLINQTSPQLMTNIAYGGLNINTGKLNPDSSCYRVTIQGIIAGNSIAKSGCRILEFTTLPGECF